MQRVLVTGANGFVGKALCEKLQTSGYSVLAAVRQNHLGSMPATIPCVPIAAIDAATDWSCALQDIDMVVHLAARVHVMHEHAEDPLAAFLRVNVEGTRNLAEQASAAGVKRFLYLSSIKVLGENTDASPFVADTAIAPEDAYARSKWMAEEVLRAIAVNSSMQVVILRPPLIYGAGVKGNFPRLVNLIQRGIPLPFASIDNRRTLLFLGNACDLIQVCLERPAAAGQTLLMGDAEAFSTAQLISIIAKSLGVKTKLWTMPRFSLNGIARCLGRSAEMNRLCDSLEVDINRTCELLAWRPPFSAQEGLEATARYFRKP